MTTRHASFVDVLRSRTAAAPAGTCFFVDDAPITWADLDAHARKLAAALRCPRGDLPARVALRVDDPRAFVLSLLGALRLGCAAIPVPSRLRAPSVAAILRNCEPEALIAEDDEAAALAASSGAARVVSAAQIAAAPPVSGAEFAPASVDPDREMLVMYSSGTTSEPKGVVHTHRTRCHAAERAGRHYYLDEQERTLINAPLYTARGVAPLLATAYAGGTSIVQNGFDAAGTNRLAALHAPTTIDMVPTQYQLLLDDASFDPKLYAECRFALCGGAALDPKLRERLLEAFPASFIQGYGSTETDFVFRMPRRPAAAKLGSVGLARDVLAEILDEHDEPLHADEIGEIVLSAPANFVRYAGDAAATASAFWTHPATGARYYRTGDLGRLDADRYLWLTGRKKDMIITAGFNIFPADVEHVVAQHPAVREAAVVGLPHRVLGETPLAFVVLDPAARAEANAGARICSWANARLNANQRLYDVRVVDGLPRNANGKVLKSRLKELAHA
jgi:acyl-CoA synthetase (AMP-forming)/AMP-acid ligase II